jgi:3,4-dihydroxy 2-butanone 4-phosphate synthase/GTP cyclohydrolase II
MFNEIEEIISDLKQGRMVIVVDDEDRENEGDIVMAAQFADTKKINFIIKNARGLLCAPVNSAKARKLNLYKMDEKNSDPYKTNWLISVDAKKGVSTGISPEDRARTLRLLSMDKAKEKDFNKPGHVFPLLSREGGVLCRAGHTEAAIDLMNLSNLKPVAVICEIISDNGSMSRLPELLEFSKKHNLKMISIEKLIEYRRKKEKLIDLISKASLPTEFGDFEIRIYREKNTNLEHVALISGKINYKEPVLLRVHSECFTGDILGSLRCDCGPQLHESMRMIARNKGVLIYMRQEGRGIGLGNKIKAYKLQEKGLDTVEANLALGFKEDLRDYGIGAQIIRDLGIRKIRLMTNNPKKVIGLKGYGLEIVETIGIKIKPNKHNEKYLKTKKIKMGHWL